MCEKMNTETSIVMDYVCTHPYSSIVDIADALDMNVTSVDKIVNDLHNEWKVFIIRDHFDPLCGLVPYDSPLVEPEIESK